MNHESSIIILHGWGLTGAKYNGLTKLLADKGYKVYAPDLPGFGTESLRSKSMNLDDYVDFISDFIKKNKISKPILIGHSFGGRVAIKYAFKYPNQILKLILTGVPIIRNRSFSKKIAFLLAVVGGKILKIFPIIVREFFRKSLYSLLGEWDYYKAGSLKQVFKNIINEDLIGYLKKIQSPIIFVWGKEDQITPVADLEKINKIVPGLKFLIIPDVGHKLPYTNPEVFLNTVESFI